jgi:hypothetical protein
MNEQELLERASNKAFSKLQMYKIDISRVKNDIKSGNLGHLTIDQTECLLRSYEIELKVWHFISELIEKSNKNE